MEATCKPKTPVRSDWWCISHVEYLPNLLASVCCHVHWQTHNSQGMYKAQGRMHSKHVVQFLASDALLQCHKRSEFTCRPCVPCRPMQSRHSCFSTMPKESSAGENLESLSIAASRCSLLSWRCQIFMIPSHGRRLCRLACQLAMCLSLCLPGVPACLDVHLSAWLSLPLD